MRNSSIEKYDNETARDMIIDLEESVIQSPNVPQAKYEPRKQYQKSNEKSFLPSNAASFMSNSFISQNLLMNNAQPAIKSIKSQIQDQLQLKKR